VKLVDDARHRALTGLPAGPILENLRALAAVHGNVWIRVPVVPGHTDAEADVAATASLVAGLGGVRRVSLLPYHRTGAAKARRLGREYALDNVDPPSRERLDGLAALFREHGLAVRIGA
jgi:pyruvate formate lyase activating enzyme